MDSGGTSKSATALFQSLHGSTFSSLPKGKGVIEIDSHMDPIDAANTLWEHNVLGVPVWDDEKKKYCGVFDLRDILSAVIVTSRALHHEGMVDPYSAVMAESLKEVHAIQEGGVHVTLKYLASRNPIHSVGPDTGLGKLCQLLSDKQCRRVLICEKEGTRCVGLVSRSTIVKYMSEHVSGLDEKLQDAGLDYRKQVLSVSDESTAFDAFKLMDAKGLYGMAVVDDDGKLLSCISARDIKIAALDKGNTPMDMDVISYISEVRMSSPPKDGKDRHPFCHVRESESIGHVLKMLVKTGYHRVFVVDTDKHPIGVISVADILRFAVEKSEKVVA